MSLNISDWYVTNSVVPLLVNILHFKYITYDDTLINVNSNIGYLKI